MVDVASYEFRYLGLDGDDYRTRVRYERAPDELLPGMARFRVTLPPLGSWAIEVTVIVGRLGVDRPRAPAPFSRRAHQLSLAHTNWHAAATGLTTDDDYFTQSLDRGLSDLYSLCIRIDGMLTITAGIPWFAAPFGRDGNHHRIPVASLFVPRRPKRRCSFLRVIKAKSTTRRATKSRGRSCTSIGAVKWLAPAKPRIGLTTARSTRLHCSWS